jgi:hypothetical protein
MKEGNNALILTKEWWMVDDKKMMLKVGMNDRWKNEEWKNLDLEVGWTEIEHN